MSTFKLLLVAAATLALGQNSTGLGCNVLTSDQPSSYQVPFNASGKVTVQATIGQDTAKTDLVFERSVSWRNSASGDNSSLHQSINLKSDRVVGKPGVTACMISFSSLDTTEKLPIKDDGSCLSVLGSGCQTAIMQKIINLGELSADQFPCTKITDMISNNFASDGTDKTCAGPVRWGAPGPKELTFEMRSTCTVPGRNIQDDGPVVAMLPAADTQWPDKKPNMTGYDLALGIPAPMIVVFTEEVRDQNDEFGGYKHTPILTCVPADSVVDGSRKLGTKDDKPGAASKIVGGFGMSAFAVAGLTVLFALNL